MIYDIKVFDKHGNLKEVINGQSYFQKIYGESDAPKASKKGSFFCKYCKNTVTKTRPNMATCGSHACRNAHRLALKPPRKGTRSITCRICKTKVEVTQNRQVTCSKKCSEENNRRTSLAGARRRQKYSGVWDRKRRELACQK